ncbi:MAG: aminotransferase class IV family protein [Campylobacterota bacterium]|nr:aminotransferase class IV family protein [Campylobacterota bacterium]
MSEKQFLEENSQAYFETIKCDDEEIFNLDYHQKRISRTIGKNINLGEYIYPPSNKLLKCKVVYNKDEILDISYSPYKLRSIKSFKIVVDDNIKYTYKAVNREDIDSFYDQKENCDEVIIIKDGLVTDTSIANIAIYKDGIWLTPKKPLLLGTTRHRLIQNNYIKEADITLDELLNCEKLALMNAMIDFKVIEEFKLLV